MFGANEITGRKYFRNLDGDVLLRTVVFPTLQGEGPLSGQRSVFLRLAKCNLACSFCDTYFDHGDPIQFEDLRDECLGAAANWLVKNTKTTMSELTDESNMLNYDWSRSWNLVITGGEPLIQPVVFDFINKLYGGYSDLPMFKKVQIETNGIMSLPYEYDEMPGRDYLMLVVSPKCPEKNGVPMEHTPPHETVMDRADCLKFVIDADPYSPYCRVPDWAFEWRRKTGRPIYVSPMNKYLKEPGAVLAAAKSNKEMSMQERADIYEKISFWEGGLLDLSANRRNHEYTADYAMKYACILSLQTHLFASLP